MDISIEFDINKLTIPRPGCNHFIKSYNDSNDKIFNDIFNLKNQHNMNSNLCESSTISLDEEIKKNILWEESNYEVKKNDIEFDNPGNEYPNETVFEPGSSEFFRDNQYYQSYQSDGDMADFTDDNVQRGDMEDDSKQSGGTIQEDSKQSECPEVVPIMNSYLNMENSNNAIDNNISTAIPKCPSNHTFKLPNTEFSFNGRIKHLQNKSKFDLSNSNRSDIEIVPNINDDSDQSETTLSPSTSFSNGIDAAIHSPIDYGISLSKEPNDSANINICKDIGEFTETSKLSLIESESNTSKNYDTDELYSLNDIRSPDIFDDEYECTEKGKTDYKIETYYEKCFNYDKNIIKKLEKILQGVPPPPSITNPQLTANDILNRYNSNIDKFNNPTSEESDAGKSTNEPTDSSNVKDWSQSIGHLNSYCTYEIAAEAKWPDILNSRYFGLHYNYTKDSEDMDSLLMRYSSRFVGCETVSSCVAAIKMRTPGKPSLRTSIGYSPGRRLSHLARRKIMYYKATSLKDPFSVNRQVLVDKKKYAALNIAKLPANRKSPRLRRTPLKMTPKKKTPKSKTPKGKGSSQKANQLRNSNNKNQSKKKLFVDTDDAKKVNTVDLSMPSTSKLLSTKRALFISPLKETSNSTEGIFSLASQGSSKSIECDRKRIKLDESSPHQSSISTTQQKVKLTKSFSFGGDKIEHTSQDFNVKVMPRYASEHFPNKVQELSDIHKKKLLWAVAQALRAHDIGVKHEQFRLYMSSLARLTRKLSALPQHAHLLRTPGTSTSETLLRISRQHSYAIIKGKSVDQIFSEEQTKQNNFRSTKAVGYVPFNKSEYYKSSQSSSISNKYNENSFGGVNNSKLNPINSAKTVLQDKTVNIDTKSSNSLSKGVKCATSNSQLLACRHLNFDNIEDSSSR